MFQVYFVLLLRGTREPCLIADALGMKQVFLHPYAGVLSAWDGVLADVRVIQGTGGGSNSE